MALYHIILQFIGNLIFIILQFTIDGYEYIILAAQVVFIIILIIWQIYSIRQEEARQQDIPRRHRHRSV